MEGLKKKTVNGVVWNGIQKFSSAGINFFFMIFMTRLLLPSDYGMVGMLAVFMAIGRAFVDCGFGQAIIRKEDRTRVDESTVFYFNIAASTACYLLLFLGAPLVASFYKMPELKLVLRVLASTLVISSLSSIHVLIYSIKLDFKTPSIVNVISSIVSGVIGLFLASKGNGVWALVFQQVFATAFNTVIYWSISKWRPAFAFSKESFKEMFGFGSKLLGSRLINNIYSNIAPIFIGRAYSPADLGLYSKAHTMMSFPSSTTYGITEAVTYPVLCKLQSDKSRLREAYRKLICSVSFILFPVMVLIGVLSKPLVAVLFGPNWSETAVYMALVCFPLMTEPIQCLNLNLLKVVGRSDLLLKLEIIAKVMGVSMLIITLPISIYAMCYGTIICTTICFFLNAHYTSRFIGLSLGTQIRDVLRSLLLSLLAGTVAFFSSRFFGNDIIQLLVGTLSGVICYFVIAFVLKMRELYELIDIIKTLLNRNNK